MTTTQIEKGKRVIGKDAERVGREITKLYAKGTPIREIAEQYGRSYGWVHRVLTQNGVELRPRGGNTRKAAAPKAPRKSSTAAIKSLIQ